MILLKVDLLPDNKNTAFVILLMGIVKEFLIVVALIKLLFL